MSYVDNNGAAYYFKFCQLWCIWTSSLHKYRNLFLRIL